MLIVGGENMDFAQRIKELRSKCGFTQKEVAKRLGVSHRTYAAYESEGRKPKEIKIYYELGRILGVSGNFLMDSEFEVPIGGNEQLAEKCTNELVAMFLDKKISQKSMDKIAKRIMDVYWEVKKQDDSDCKGVKIK